MKKYLSTLGVSFMLTLTTTTLSAAAIAEEGICADRYDLEGLSRMPEQYYPLLRQYESALTSNDTSLMKSIEKDLPSGESWVLWKAVSAAMKQAYQDGNIEALETIKATALAAGRGFSNINDLGEPFFKYGAGMRKWDQLIEDAKANQTK